jgi:hypothetical protein
MLAFIQRLSPGDTALMEISTPLPLLEGKALTANAQQR